MFLISVNFEIENLVSFFILFLAIPLGLELILKLVILALETGNEFLILCPGPVHDNLFLLVGSNECGHSSFIFVHVELLEFCTLFLHYIVEISDLSITGIPLLPTSKYVYCISSR